MTKQAIVCATENYRRVGSMPVRIYDETQAWAKEPNQKQKGVIWQFSIEKARHKLKSIYPKIKC